MGYMTTDSRGRYLYREHLDDARRALRRAVIAGYATIIFGGLGVMLAIALTGGL